VHAITLWCQYLLDSHEQFGQVFGEYKLAQGLAGAPDGHVSAVLWSHRYSIGVKKTLQRITDRQTRNTFGEVKLVNEPWHDMRILSFATQYASEIPLGCACYMECRYLKMILIMRSIHIGRDHGRKVAAVLVLVEPGSSIVFDY